MIDSELAALYQDIIIDHNKSPRNFREIPPPRHEADGYNPLCGDRLSVYLTLDGDRISDVSFKGSGCAISVASASLMTEVLKGRTAEEAKALFERMHALLTGQDDGPSDIELGKLEALAGVRAYPSRVKCATLAWHTVQSALEDDNDSVTTE
ncbi:MAG TPA: SUF system NifU family Fe-S cluster assembly protein [Gammaproteobacteria bacterium]|nr:SUF system NifU family Fe-S cluster assembly protein [Gammaproteobacteria bacterium]